MSYRERAIKALLGVEDLVIRYGDEKVRGSYYLEFWRRIEVIENVLRYCEAGPIVDIGASPFIMSCALSMAGFRVYAIDIEPEHYIDIAKNCGVEVIKADLEKEKPALENQNCAIFTEVLEHINPYYAPSVLANINRMLKNNGYLILTTPNIVSLFRRIKLVLGKQPQYRLHVHEYTKTEVEELLSKAGFKIVKSYYSLVNDLTYLDLENKKEYIALGNYKALIKATVKCPTKTNIARALAYPLVKIIPSLRQLIVIIAEKIQEPANKPIERW